MFRRGRSRPGKVVGYPETPTRRLAFDQLTPGRHERRGRHEAPRVAGVVELPRTMTDDEVLAWKTEWLEARARERRHPILKVSRL